MAAKTTAHRIMGDQARQGSASFVSASDQQITAASLEPNTGEPALFEQSKQWGQTKVVVEKYKNGNFTFSI